MSTDITALRERIASAPQITTDVIDDLNTLTLSLLDTDLPAAFENAQRTIRDAYAIRYAEGESQALIHAATSAVRRNQYDEAIILYQRAMRIKEEAGDMVGIAVVLTKMGNTELRADKYADALDYYARAIKQLDGTQNDMARADLYANTALIQGLKGNYTMALKHHLLALKTYETYNETGRIAASLANMGLIYTEQQNYEEAMNVYNRALEIRRDAEDTMATSDLLDNIGIVYQEQELYTEALDAHNSALILRQGDSKRTANSQSNLGNTYKKLGDNDVAKDYYEKALVLYDSINDKRGLLQSYNNLGELYYGLKEYEKAQRYLEAAMKLASETGLKLQLRQAYEYISLIYAHRRQFEQAYQYKLLFSKLDREISSSEVKTQMSQITLRYEIEQKEQAAEMERVKNTELQKAFDLLEEEQKRSENLLLNILPAEVSYELKESGKTRARSYDMVTVLFADIKGFTMISQRFSAEEIVSSIDEYFEMFDLIMERHGVEKIKTIGDAYLCVSGVPVAAPDHAEKMILVAKDMIAAVTQLKEKREGRGEYAFDFRVGISSGPVVAGVVGIKKFAYDIWGDTVNTASRMQSNGEPHRINISESTYILVKDTFDCIYRGEIEAKNKGKLKMYFVK
ncbi:MAG: hypothetical protein JWO03_3166 [Bacteroidetes bacterium]|nr:hypothetical protein [Bacteroidota bacterium]